MTLKGVLKVGKKIAKKIIKLGIIKILLILLIPIILIFIIIASLAVLKVAATSGDDPQTFPSGIVEGTTPEKIWFAMLDAGFSKEQTASAMGFMWAESGLRTDTVASTGRGLCGWLDVLSGQDLVAYGQSKGKEWSDPDTQIEFLIAWLTGQGPAKEYALRHNTSLGGIQRTYRGITYPVNAWKNYKTTGDVNKDISYLTWAYYANYGGGQDYEWDGNTGDNRRIVHALEIYNQYKDKTRPSSSGGGGQPNISGGGGTETPSTTRGIKGYFKSACSGRTFTEYYQNDGNAWNWNEGCWVCTQATIMSGFGGTKTPNELPGFMGLAQQSTWSTYANCKCERKYNVSATDIKNYLKKGEAIHIRVEGNTLNTDNGSHYFAGHSLALLDYKEENGKDKVYLLDPWKGDPTYGWTDVETLAKCLVWYERIWQ